MRKQVYILAAVVSAALALPGSVQAHRFTIILECWHVRHHRIECQRRQRHVVKHKAPAVVAPMAPVAPAPVIAAPPPVAPALPAPLVPTDAKELTEAREYGVTPEAEPVCTDAVEAEGVPCEEP